MSFLSKAVRRASVLWVVMLSLTRTAHATEPASTLEVSTSGAAWIGECLPAGKLNASFEAARAAERSPPLQADALRVDVAPASSGDLLEIQVRRAGRVLGSRTLRADSRQCAALPDAVALVVLLLARSEAAPPAPAPTPAEPTPAAVPAPASPREPIERPPGPASAAPPAAPILAIGAGASIVFGVLPSAAIALRVSVETAPALFAVQLAGAFLWPQVRQVAEGSVDFSGYEAALRGCFEGGLGSTRLALRACAGPSVAILRAAGREFRIRNETAVEVAIRADLQAQAAWQFAPSTRLAIGGGAGIALLRPQFVLGIGDSRARRPLPSPALVAGEVGIALIQIF